MAAALRSVAAQRLPGDCRVEIIVVDDASPVAAAAEVCLVALPEGTTCRVIHQKNGGPGAARNAALESLKADPVDFIAFLDSDDCWDEDHLAVAMRALNDRADFYFCDHTRFDIEGSYFAQIERSGSVLPQVASADGAGDRLHQWQPAVATDNFATEYYSMTSTVVARWRVISALRFDTDLRSAGEDALFWIDCARVSRLVVFSMRVHVHCGRGVNIYNGNFDWNSEAGADRFGYLALMYAKKAGRCPNNATVRSRMRRAEIAYAYLLVRRSLTLKSVDTNIMRAMFRSAPAMIFRIPWRALQYPLLRRRIDWNF